VTVYGYTVTIYGFLTLRFTGFMVFSRLPRISQNRRLQHAQSPIQIFIHVSLLVRITFTFTFFVDIAKANPTVIVATASFDFSPSVRSP
jgi:hypothetical protein